MLRLPLLPHPLRVSVLSGWSPHQQTPLFVTTERVSAQFHREKSELQEALEAAQSRLDVFAAARDAASRLDPDGLCGTVVQQARRVLGADKASLFLVDEVTDELWTKAGDSDRPIRLPRRTGLDVVKWVVGL